MSKTRRNHKNKRGGFLEHFTRSINSGANSISNSSKGALDTINKSASDTKNSIGNFFSSGYNKVFGKKNSTSSMPLSTMSSSTMPYNSTMPSTSMSSSTTMSSSSIPLNKKYKSNNDSSLYKQQLMYNDALNTGTSLSSNVGSGSNDFFGSFFGGRKHRGTRKMHRGGKYVSNTNLNNLASHASPISGINTAKPCSWVGGKRKSRKARKSRKSRK